MVATWVPAYVALGSNLDDPQQQIRRALELLASLPETRLVLTSRLYRTVPLGPQDQPEFINAAAGLLTQLSARDLLGHLKGIEASMGRASPTVPIPPAISMSASGPNILRPTFRAGPKRIPAEKTCPHCSRVNTAQSQSGYSQQGIR